MSLNRKKQKKVSDRQIINDAVDSAIADIFELLPAEVKKGNKLGDRLNVKAKTDKEWIYKTHDEMDDGGEYSSYAARALYDIFVILKNTSIKNILKAALFRPKNSDLNTVGELFQSLDRLYFRINDSNGKLVEAILNENTVKWPLIQPTFKNDYTVNKVITTYEEGEEGIDYLLTLFKVNDQKKESSEDQKKELAEDLTKESPEEQKEKLFSVTSERSWLPHVVDNLSFKLALIIYKFTKKIENISWLPGQEQFKNKLDIIYNRLSVYYQTYQLHLFAKLGELTRAINTEAPMTETTLDDIKNKITDLKQRHQAWLESSEILDTEKSYEGISKSVLNQIQEFDQRYNKKLSAFLSTNKNAIYERSSLSELNTIKANFLKDKIKAYKKSDHKTMKEIDEEIKLLDPYIINRSRNDYYRATLKKVCDSIKGHEYNLHGGFGKKVDGIDKRISTGAAFVYTLVKPLLDKMKAGANLTDEEFIHMRNQVNSALNHKQSSHWGFLGIGARDKSTAALYQNILNLLNPRSKRVASASEEQVQRHSIVRHSR